MHKKTFRWLGLTIAIIVAAIDQVSKWWIVKSISLGDSISVFPGFDIIQSHNKGAAFGLLNDGSSWQRWFFISLAAVIGLVIFVWLGRLKQKNKLEMSALSLILGGAIGNLIDRINQGHVIDFLLFYYKEWAFPVFNIADIAICVGAFIFALLIFKKA